MKRRSLFALSSILIGIPLAGAHAGEALDRIKQKGVFVAGVKDRAPPFGFLESGSGHIVGYDVDFVSAIAKRLGAQVRLRPVTPGSRIGALLDGEIDIAASMEKNPDRGKVIGFSDTYLVSGQSFLAKKGLVQSLNDLAGKKIGALQGSFSERNAKTAIPGATLVSFGDYRQAVQALQEGRVDAVTTDRSILLDLVASLPKGEYEIPEIQISEERYAFGIRKGDQGFLDAVNGAIRELQQGGEAKRIYEKWFVPHEELASAAYGAIIRSAATPPRFLAVDLKGIFLPGSSVSIYTLDGSFLCEGKVKDVFADQFYLDADKTKYELVQPGFLVAMNMGAETAKDVAARHGELLRSVRAESEKQAKAFAKEIEREGKAEERRRQEADLMEEQARLSMEEEEIAYYYGYYFR